ncbi:RagB/SusD family nutrient uptake outer membrane protein [Sinomicrobium oceani]|uniref:RagB/SusD family nutrient uptake outer membrane protein n=1 Tax=Sinomicrobium oceani TaxID=1150368 RepID=UPI00227C1DF1|nr:RagB/SusD family nutrient uptake outer membrane protein [Sinomicrobium oceani]
MKSKKYKVVLMLLSSSLLMESCEDFVDVETPNYKMVTETIFADDETAIAAVTGIYNELFVSTDFANGNINSVTVLSGMSSDIFETTSATDSRYGPFQQNEISPGETPDAMANYELWSSAYTIIYMSNSILEGLAHATQVSDQARNMVEGQARFIRAFTYFYLIQLYGNVPLILSTDYRLNAVAERDTVEKVMEQITIDLDMALSLLENVVDYKNIERIHVNRYVVAALRARVYLYARNWEKAEALSSRIIEQTSLYEVLEDPDQVFLKNSREAIWQITPIVAGIGFSYTREGYFFRGINSSPVKLSDDFIAAMDTKDKRLSHWVGFNKSREFYYPQKYKDGSSRNNVTEYSMVLRLAEQHLIRAEARAMQGKLKEAIADLDVTRNRANLDLISDTNPGIGQEALLEEIMAERKREFFSEWGHRWLDLKRTGKATAILAPIKPQWQPTDVYYPIPDEDRLKNPNLEQNEGY